MSTDASILETQEEMRAERAETAELCTRITYLIKAGNLTTTELKAVLSVVKAIIGIGWMLL